MRFVTASLFDGHDAAINIMRRILQDMGAEVIHLGHNRSVQEIVTAALQEDAQRHRGQLVPGRAHGVLQIHDGLAARPWWRACQVFGGGGGIDRPSEIRELQDGVARIWPRRRTAHGPQGHDRRMLMRCDQDLASHAPRQLQAVQGHTPAHWRALAQLITALENGRADAALLAALREQFYDKSPRGRHHRHRRGRQIVPDRRLIRRLRLDQNDALRVAVISIDPSRRKSGGALLGDRIRMNAIGPWSHIQGRKMGADADFVQQSSGSDPVFRALSPVTPDQSTTPRIFMRSLATRLWQRDQRRLPDVLAPAK